MSERCVILCPRVGYTAALLAVQGLYDPAVLRVEGSPTAWRRIVIETDPTTLTLTSVDPDRSSDQFKTLIRETHGQFEPIHTDAIDAKREALKHITSCVFVITADAKPAFSDEAHHYECLFGLALETDGVIFDGYSLIGAHGYVILNTDGEKDHLIQGG